MNALATLNRNVSLDDMVLCDFNIGPKLKYKHIYNLINEGHSSDYETVVTDMQELGLSRQRNFDNGTLHSILSNELGKY